MSDTEYLVSLSFEDLGNGMQAEDRLLQPQPVDGIANLPVMDTEPSATTMPQQSEYGLPSFIRSLPASLTAADIDELTRHGALTLPEDDLQHELFRKYILYVHAFLPVINLSAFFSPISRRDGAGTVSLLVYQAVMFASAAYVDPEYSDERGYQGRKSLRQTFFKRARMLYDLKCESDPLSVLQALLLMTCWYKKSEEDEEETWQLMGTALSLAKSLNIHCNPEHLNISPELKHIRKKIWWSCFVRDRLLSLGMGRPARIHPGDYDVPMLTMEDCEMTALEDDTLHWVGPIPVADDCPTKASIYLCFVELVQLCVRMGDSLLQNFSILSNPANIMAQTISLMVIPMASVTYMRDTRTCDVELQGWQQRLTPGCRYTKGTLTLHHETRLNESHRLLRLYQALLHVVYLTAMAVLHQSEMLQMADANGSGTRRDLLRLSRDKVTIAAADITDIMAELYDDDQLRFAPTVTIPALMSATLTHLIDIRSSASSARYTSMGRFFLCWQALQCLRDMYASADHALAFLETVIMKSGIRIPLLTMSPLSRQLALPVDITGSQAQVPSVSEALDPNVADQAVDNIQTLVAASHPDNAATYAIRRSNSVRKSRAHDSLVEPEHEELDTNAVVEPQSEAWNGIEIGEDLLQTLHHFKTWDTFFPGV